MPESPLDITILIDDLEMQRLVATWPKLSEECRQRPSDIARASNISIDRIEDIVFRAMAHKIIYPDGSINSYAEKWISGMVGARIAEQIGRASKARGKRNDAGNSKAD